MSASRTGHRIVFAAPGEIEIESFVVRDPAEGEVLIDVASTLISAGTELSYLTGTHIGILDSSLGLVKTPAYPFEPGYSSTGVVAAVGEGVSNLKVGDRVFSSAGHRSHVVCRADPASVQKLPGNVTFDEGTFVRIGTPALLASHQAEIALGETVVVVGLGLIGLLVAQVAKLSGAGRLVGVDIREDRLELARRLCADEVVNSATTDLLGRIRALTGGNGAPVVMDATGNSKVFPIALKLAATYGRVMLVGCPHEPVSFSLFPDAFFRALTIKSCVGRHIPDTAVPQFPWSRPVMHQSVIDLISRGELQVDDLITQKVPWIAAPSIYRKFLESPGEGLGYVLDWTQS